MSFKYLLNKHLRLAFFFLPEAGGNALSGKSRTPEAEDMEMYVYVQSWMVRYFS